MSKVATIAAQISKRRILCRISIEVLEDRFDASREEPMVAVARNRATLQAIAKRLIEAETFEEDGSVVILREHL